MNRMRPRKSRAIGILAAVMVALTVGCQPSESPTSSLPPPAVSPTPSAASGARGLFDQHCAKCHAIDEASAGRKKMGPSLVGYGADAAHTLEWTATHIRDAKGHEPMSRMPRFDEKLSDEEIDALARYLLDQK